MSKKNKNQKKENDHPSKDEKETLRKVNDSITQTTTNNLLEKTTDVVKLKCESYLQKYGVKPNVSGTKTNDVLKLITNYSQKTMNAIKNGEKLRDGENCLSYDTIAKLVHSPKRQPVQHLIKRIILNKNNPIVRCVLPVIDKKQPIYIPLNITNIDAEMKELILNNIDTDKPEDKATAEKLKGFFKSLLSPFSTR